MSLNTSVLSLIKLRKQMLSASYPTTAFYQIRCFVHLAQLQSHYQIWGRRKEAVSFCVSNYTSPSQHPCVAFYYNAVLYCCEHYGTFSVVTKIDIWRTGLKNVSRAKSDPCMIVEEKITMLLLVQFMHPKPVLQFWSALFHNTWILRQHNSLERDALEPAKAEFFKCRCWNNLATWKAVLWEAVPGISHTCDHTAARKCCAAVHSIEHKQPGSASRAAAQGRQKTWLFSWVEKKELCTICVPRYSKIPLSNDLFSSRGYCTFI